MARAAGQLEATRPTAVNLAWATRRCLERARGHAELLGQERVEQMIELARTIHRDDVGACRRMGAVGADAIAGERLLTHCNAGALATGGYGTALGVVRARAAAGSVRVFAGETRPYLQGARLTAWELQRDGIDVTVVSDNIIGHCMQKRLIDAVIVGADRIARNGDVANKIGTYGIACLAHAHAIPFYVAAPWSTVDLEKATGTEIPIEERSAVELTRLGDQQLVPVGVAVYNPAFDVTPARLITAIITERGAFEPGRIAAAG
jgi:methylthioribose-1-phosphate isomerase